jgi:hypothetical protein
MVAQNLRIAWIKSSNFWHPFIAALALIFSQLPPISEWIPRKELILKLDDSIVLRSFFGRFNLDIKAAIYNNGNTSEIIDRVKVNIEGPEGPLDNYIVDPFMTLSSGENATAGLKSGEQWKGPIFIYKKSTPNQEKEETEINAKVLDDYRKNIHLMQRSQTNGYYYRVSPQILTELETLYNSRQNLQLGKYTVRIDLVDAGDRVLASEAVSFTIHESHIITMNRQKLEYQYGNALLSHMSKPLALSVPTESVPLD